MLLTNPHIIRGIPKLKDVERFWNGSFHEFCRLKALITLKQVNIEKILKREILVVYHLPKFTRKSGWTVNGTRRFGSFHRRISGSNGKSNLLFRTGYSKRKFVFHFFKDIFVTGFRPSRSFFAKWNLFVQMVNVIPEQILPVLNFTYHLPRQWTDRFALVNGKQPLFCDVLRRYVSQNTVLITGTLQLNRFTLLYVFQ